MVIKREDAITYVSDEMQLRLSELEARIDQELKNKWFPGSTVSITVPENLGVKRRWYIEEIGRRYRDAGWGVQFNSARDQRDSDYFQFS